MKSLIRKPKQTQKANAVKNSKTVAQCCAKVSQAAAGCHD